MAQFRDEDLYDEHDHDIHELDDHDEETDAHDEDLDDETREEPNEQYDGYNDELDERNEDLGDHDEDLDDETREELDRYSEVLDDCDEELDDQRVEPGGNDEDLGDETHDSRQPLPLTQATAELREDCPQTGTATPDGALSSAFAGDEIATEQQAVDKEVEYDDDGTPWLTPLAAPTAPPASLQEPGLAAGEEEVITSNKEISADREKAMKQEILLLDTQGLIARGIEAVRGFRLSRLEKAMILAEAKERYSKGGAPGRRPDGEMTWARYCRAIGEPLASAETLVKRYDVYLRMSPTLRAKAEAEQIDVMKPKVLKVFEELEEEVWELPEATPDQIKLWLERLRDAQGRETSPPVPPSDAQNVTPTPSAAAPQKPGRNRGQGRNVSAGTGGRIITLDAAGLKRLGEDIAKIRIYTGWDAGTVTESETIARSIAMLRASLEVEHENANLRR